MTSLSSLEEISAFLKKHPKLIFADDFEIVVQYESSQKRKFLEGKAVDRQNHEGFWVSVRLLHRKRPGRAVTSDVSPQGLRLVVEQALQSAEQSSIDPWFRFPIWKPVSTTNEAYENAQYDSLAPHVSHLPPDFEERYSTRALHTLISRKTEKQELRSFQNGHEGSLSLSSSKEPDAARLTESWSTEKNLSDRGKRLERLTAQAALHGKLGKRLAPVSDAKQVVLSAAVAADWLQAVGKGFSAHEAFRSRTFWGMAPEIVSPELTLWDDPKASGIAMSSPFDLEGSLTQKTLLIERGERKNLLHDAYTSVRDNRGSTGNFYRREGEATASIQPWNLVLAPGPKAEPWSDSQHVVFIDQATPIESSQRGSWDRLVSGVLMRRSEPIARVKPFRVRWSILEMLQGVSGVDNTLQTFNNISCPCLWWDNLPKGTREAL